MLVLLSWIRIYQEVVRKFKYSSLKCFMLKITNIFLLQVEGHFGGVRFLSEGRGSQLLLGTTRNCILVGTVDMGFQPIVLGHTDELWALAAHPTVPQFATAGQDKLLQMWDSMSHSILWSKDIGVRYFFFCLKLVNLFNMFYL